MDPRKSVGAGCASGGIHDAHSILLLRPCLPQWLDKPAFHGGDHHWGLDHAPDTFVRAAQVVEPAMGRILDASTGMPCRRCSGGNFLPAVDAPADQQINGKRSVPYHYRDGFCLESQHAPDSSNQPTFPATPLCPGQAHGIRFEYRFDGERRTVDGTEHRDPGQ